jgi:hypothetical protein
VAAVALPTVWISVCEKPLSRASTISSEMPWWRGSSGSVRAASQM